MTLAPDRTRTRWRLNDAATVSTDGSTLLVQTPSRSASVAAPGLLPFVTGLLRGGPSLDLPDPDTLTEAQRRKLDEVLDLLVGLDVVVAAGDVPEEDWGPTRALWDRGGRQVELEVVHERLRTRSVSVVGRSRAADDIAAALSRGGLRTVHRLPDPRSAPVTGDAVVVVAAGTSDPLLDRWNREALDGPGVPWLVVTPPRGGRWTQGPWVFPRSSACWECCRIRRSSVERDPDLRSLVRTARQVPDHGDGGDAAVPDLYAGDASVRTLLVTAAADSALCQVVLGDVQGAARPGGTTTFEYTLDGLVTTNHHVLRVPRCPECSTTSGTGFPPVWFHRREEGEGR